MPGGCGRSVAEAGHFDAAGRARMVDVGQKPVTERVAVARGRIALGGEAYSRVAAGTAAKGDVLGVARLAGIMAAKRTSETIPLCHPVPLAAVEVRFRLQQPDVWAEAEVRCADRTGVEMEALCAVSAALLTVYDMVKAYGRGHTVGDIRLLSKSGGRSGEYRGEGADTWPQAEIR